MVEEMTAKKDKIKELRDIIADQDEQIATLQINLLGKDRHVQAIEKQYKAKLSMLNNGTTDVAQTLKRVFKRDLTWQTLSEDPDSQMRELQEVIKNLFYIAKQYR